MDNKPYVPAAVIKDDFKYWEFVWPRISIQFDLNWLNNQISTYSDKMAQEYAFLCHHHDKCIQYRDLWEERGVPWRHAVMVYMLSFSQFKGNRCDVGSWVAQYTNEIIEALRVVEHYEQMLEADFFKADLDSYETRLLEMASKWVRGTMNATHSYSFVHTGHNALKKMQLATRIARTLKDSMAMHCWRHSHGELQPGDQDFITKFTFGNWAEA